MNRRIRQDAEQQRGEDRRAAAEQNAGSSSAGGLDSDPQAFDHLERSADDDMDEPQDDDDADNAAEDAPPDADNAADDAPPWLRLFMLLVIWLSCARGLPRTCADILLAFVADIVQVGRASVQPRHIVTVKKRVGFNPSFARFVICPNDDCQKVVSLSDASEACQSCGSTMLDEGRLDRPLRYFKFSSLIGFLEESFRRRSFEHHINSWRTRRGTGKIEDVTDGLAWREDDFTSNRLNLYLTVGLDWFVAFSSPNTATYTVGVVSVRIENLPPHLRNRPEFVHVSCILPGPKQCSEAGLSAAMAPLMDELKRLDEGIPIRTPGFPLARTMRARVLMAIGDLPARAKLGGFPSHSQGGEWCGHCLANSSTWVDALLRDEVPTARRPEDHRRGAFAVRDAPLLRTQILHSHGATWTPLYALPYWRSVRSVPVDAMHALHLGACKRFFHLTLIEGGLLKLERGRLPIIAAVLESATYPRGVASIRHNWGLKSAGSPTADAWSTFSRFLLPLVLASHWSEELRQDATATFTTTNATLRQGGGPPFVVEVHVRAILEAAIDLCHIVHLAQKRSISVRDLEGMERSIRNHVKAMATMIDTRWPVPNHHALTHLPDHIRRFGPARCFWFYAQERLNGFLKKTMHNQRHGGELESTMQENHALYRSTRNSLGTLGDSPLEVAFKEIMKAHHVSLDPGEEMDDVVVASSGTTSLSGPRWSADLEPAVVQAIAAMVNHTRADEDSLAVADFAWDGETPATLIVSDAEFTHNIIVQHTIVTAKATRLNTPPGATFVLIRSGSSTRLAQLLSAFEHTYAHSQTGELMRQQYALLDVFRCVRWPEGHCMGGTNAARLGYILCDTTDPQRTLLPLATVEDACVTATARYITGDDSTIMAARMHP